MSFYKDTRFKIIFKNIIKIMAGLETRNELERRRRNAAIIADYNALRGDNPGASKNRIAVKLAAKYKLTVQMIGRIIASYYADGEQA